MIITFTTDFGISDGFAGIMKGVVLSINPQAVCLDISHQIKPGDIRSAAWVIRNAYRYFPQGSVHVIVVDPGVGSRRRGIVMVGSDHLFVCPDNGILTLILNEDKQSSGKAFEIANHQFWLPSVSHTFHGRDIFAPVAAHLANGVPAEEVGPAINVDSLVKFRLPVFATTANQVRGSIVYVDHFGNLITNIAGSYLTGARACFIAGIELPIGLTYSSVAAGQAVACAGSHGFVEIGVNNGRADSCLQVGIDESVTLNGFWS